MPSLSDTPRVPSYRRHRPSGQAVVTLGGRDFYLGRWNTKVSRAEYDRLIGEWLAAGRRLPTGDEPQTQAQEAAGQPIHDGQLPAGDPPGGGSGQPGAQRGQPAAAVEPQPVTGLGGDGDPPAVWPGGTDDHVAGAGKTARVAGGGLAVSRARNPGANRSLPGVAAGSWRRAVLPGNHHHRKALRSEPHAGLAMAPRSRS